MRSPTSPHSLELHLRPGHAGFRRAVTIERTGLRAILANSKIGTNCNIGQNVVKGERLNARHIPRARSSRLLLCRSAAVHSDPKWRPCCRCARPRPEPQPNTTSHLHRPGRQFLHLYDSNLTKRYVACTMGAGKEAIKAGAVGRMGACRDARPWLSKCKAREGWTCPLKAT